jgi:hypothetical protein
VLLVGVPSGEWNGEDWSLNKGAAIARLDFVRIIEGGPIAPKGDAERGDSTGTSFQGSLGSVIGMETGGARVEGLKVAALALSIRGDVTGEIGVLSANTGF